MNTADDRYEYDADGNWSHIRARSMNSRSRLATPTTTLGRLVTRDLPSGARLRYGYGNSSAVQSITLERWLDDELARRSGYGQAIDGETGRTQRRLTFGNGIETRTTFDARSGSMSRRTIEGIAALEYEHDEAGRIVGLSRNKERRTSTTTSQVV